MHEDRKAFWWIIGIFGALYVVVSLTICALDILFTEEMKQHAAHIIYCRESEWKDGFCEINKEEVMHD